MKVALVLSILVLLIGLGYSFKLSDFFEEDTQRQSSVEDQILPVFTIAFFASLFNSLIFGLKNQNTGNTCECGVRGPNRRRIVQGENAETGEFPWQVRFEIINDLTDNFCGGTLLSSDTVLTIASCFDDTQGSSSDPIDWSAIVGDTDRTSPDGEQTFFVRQIIFHPDFDTTTRVNDFAIVKLATPVTFSDSIAPICLPTATTNYDNVLATLTGWGGATPTPGDNNFNILQKADVRTMTNAQCTAANPDPVPSEICASNIAGTNFCINDVGSPLITNEGRFNSLIGIVSANGALQLGNANCDPFVPGLYARVTSGLPWIEQQISGDTCPRPT